MRVLSFDCANRSLAVCFATINEKERANVTATIKSGMYNKTTMNNYAKIHLLKVFDVTKGDKCTTETRALLLKQCLLSVDKDIEEMKMTPTNVLIEYQMSANDKSRCVSQQILYHYSGIETNPTLVGPTLKNKVCLSNDDTLEHSTFMGKYASKYTANKNHSKANFLHWIQLTDQKLLLRDIEKKNYDDAADAFMQIFGWLWWGSTAKPKKKLVVS
jgi:hypothetical protein